MKGLIKHHYYKIISNLSVLLVFILLAGILILIFGDKNETLLMAFLGLTVIGLPFISSISLIKNNGGKWKQYILSLPVKRNYKKYIYSSINYSRYWNCNFHGIVFSVIYFSWICIL